MSHEISRGSPERPWLMKLTAVELPESLGEALQQIRQLMEIQAHRDWVIEGLRAHITNLESDLLERTAHARNVEHILAELESHARNLEQALAERASRLDDVQRHAANLECRLEERETQLEDVQRHVVNLERRLPSHRARLSSQEILPESASPRLAPLLDAGNRLWKSRPDLQNRFPADQAASFWYWLLWHGAAATEGGADGSLPLPPDHLRGRVVGQADTPEGYLRSGLVDWWRLEEGLRQAGFEPTRGGRVLDFGVGCGRILQGFALYSGHCELTGADVDDEAVHWCRRYLDFARFETLPQRPPSALRRNSFEAIYAFSVFSHLPEGLQRAWLEELARLAAPGAALAITVQGRHVVEKMTHGCRRVDASLSRALRKRQTELEERGFLFVPYRRLAFEDQENSRFFESWDLENYGETFILESYIREHWSDLFEITAYHEAPDDWQDLVVLRPR